MLIYLCVFLILFGLAFLDLFSNDQRLKIYGLYFSFVVLLFFVGLRDETGTDWLPYKEYFELVSSNSNTYDFNFEFGYSFIVKIGALIGLNYHSFLFIYTFAYLAIFYICFARAKNPNTLVFLFYSIYLIGLMGTARQIFAMALCTCALDYLIRKKNFVFFSLVILSSTVHIASLIFLLFLFAQKNIDYSYRNFLLFTIVVLLLYLISPVLFEFITYIARISPRIGDRLAEYVISENYTQIYVAADSTAVVLLLTKRVVIFILIFYWIKVSPFAYSNQIILNGYAFGIIIFSILYSIAPAVAIRLSLYFSFFDIFVLSNFATKKRRYLFFLIFIFVFSFERFASSLTYDSDLLIPYKGLIFNTDVYRTLR